MRQTCLADHIIRSFCLNSKDKDLSWGYFIGDSPHIIEPDLVYTKRKKMESARKDSAPVP